MVTTRLPSAGFSITIRIAVTADASSIGRLTTCVGEAGAIVTALDVVDSDPTRVLVDLTCDTADASHADQVVKELEKQDGVDVRKVSDRTFLLHLGGKIEVSSKVLTTWSAWPESAVSQVRSTRTRDGSESTTSSAVTIAPASPTQVVSLPMDDASAVTAIRIVIENPALGRRVVTTVFPPSLAGTAVRPPPHCCASGIAGSNPLVTTESPRDRFDDDTSDNVRPGYVDAPLVRACHDRGLGGFPFA